MSNTYNNPIILELLAEIHFPAGSLSPDKFFSIVPSLKEQGLSRVELANLSQLSISPGQPVSAQSMSVPRVKCWDSANQKLVQLGPDLMVVNLIGKYPGWKAFQDLFGTAIDAVEKAQIGRAPDSISLTTIDRFEVNKKDFTLDQYVNCGGPTVPAMYKDSRHAVDVILGHGNLKMDHFNRQFKLKVSHKIDKMEIIVESVFHDLLKNTDDIDVVLERLHEESNSSFESWITIKTREEVMGGLK